jgi:hypothetical protein
VKPIDPELDPRCTDITAYPGHIVFVHVGPNQPRLCLSDAADQAFEEDPDALVWIFTERDYGPRIQGRMKYGSATRVRFVFTDEVPVLSLHEEFREKRKFPPGGGDFWRVTSERFYYLHDLMLHLNLRVVVHLESDVMIYAPLTALINSKRGSATVLYPLDKTRGIASVLFIQDAIACALLCRHGIDYPTKHDMDLLEKFYQANKRAEVASLPTIPETICLTHGLDYQRYARPRSEGWGIFDAAAIGQFLGGIDPIHDRRDTRGFVNEESPIEPKKLAVSWTIEQAKRRPISAATEPENIRNLHIHSKRTGTYRTDNHCVPEYEEEIITGERVMCLCDVSLTTYEKLAFHKIKETRPPPFLNINDYHKPGTTFVSKELIDRLDQFKLIHCYGDHFRFFVDLIAPYLESPHTIVVHNSDTEISGYYDKIFDNKNILRVFGMSMLSSHPQMTGIPAGLANPMWPHGDTSAFFSYCMHIRKQRQLYAGGIGSTHISRKPLITALEKLALANGLRERHDFKTHIEHMAKSSHVVCPRGNAVESHRLWEALYTGGIPVITPTEVHRALPTEVCLSIDSWTSLEDLNILEMLEIPPVRPNTPIFMSQLKAQIQQGISIYL